MQLRGVFHVQVCEDGRLSKTERNKLRAKLQRPCIMLAYLRAWETNKTRAGQFFGHLVNTAPDGTAADVLPKRCLKMLQRLDSQRGGGDRPEHAEHWQVTQDAVYDTVMAYWMEYLDGNQAFEPKDPPCIVRPMVRRWPTFLPMSRPAAYNGPQ